MNYSSNEYTSLKLYFHFKENILYQLYPNYLGHDIVPHPQRETVATGSQLARKECFKLRHSHVHG